MSGTARESMLEAGLDLLHAAGLRPGVGHVKLEQAARRAGYTTGAAYRCWATQDDFHHDLALAAMRWRDRVSVADAIASIRALVDADAPLDEVLRIATAANVGRSADESDYFLPLALRATGRFDADLAVAARARVEEGLGAHQQIHEVLLAKYGRRVRPPLTTRDLTTVVAAIADGFAVQDVGGEHRRVTLDEVGAGVGRDWTLLGIVIRAIVDRLTEPIATSRCGAASDQADESDDA